MVVVNLSHLVGFNEVIIPHSEMLAFFTSFPHTPIVGVDWVPMLPHNLSHGTIEDEVHSL